MLDNVLDILEEVTGTDEIREDLDLVYQLYLKQLFRIGY